MASPIFFPNLRKDGDRAVATGTTVNVGGEDHACIDAFIQNTVADPIPVAITTSTFILETRFHDCSVTNIQDVGGVFVEIGTSPVAAATATAMSSMMLSCTFGEPVNIRLGANAAAAAAASDLVLVNQGQSMEVPVTIPLGSRIWVRSKSATAVNTGYLTLNLIG